MDKQFFNVLVHKSGINLNKQQKDAVLHVKGPALVLAAPGSGKTTMLLCRTANLVMNEGVDPAEILTLTFNRAAVRDMEERYQRLFGWTDIRVNFSTIHAYALKIIRKHKTGEKFNIIEGDNSRINKTSILKKLYYEANNEYIADDKLEELSRNISYLKNMMIGENEIKEFKWKVDNFKEIYMRYEAIKKSHSYIDFDDMLTISYDILRSNPVILSAFKRQYKYIQIDEFQDNSKIQNEIVKILAAPENSLFAVADDDQSIYGFRGAYPEGALNFKDDFRGAKIFLMEQNYRSTGAIVDTAGEFIKSNKLRYGKNIFTSNKEGKAIEILHFKDNSEQASFIAQRINNDKDPGDNAVLFRNNVSSVIIADEFSRRGIPFYMKDGRLNFFNHWVVDDIISFMQLSMDNSDIDSFKKIYYKCGCYIPKQAMDQTAEKHKSGPVLETLRSYPGLSGFQLGRITVLEQTLRHISYLRPAAAIGLIENEIGYKNYLNENGTRKGYSLENIDTILDCLKSIAMKTKTIIEFLARLSNLSDIISDSINNRGKEAVVLSTLHSAKGLEFKRVYMIDMTDGTFPGTGSIEEFERGDPSLLEEERRLCYVGITRAKQELFLCLVDSKNGNMSAASRFIDEISSINKAVESRSRVKII